MPKLVIKHRPTDDAENDTALSTRVSSHTANSVYSLTALESFQPLGNFQSIPRPNLGTLQALGRSPEPEFL